MGASLFLQPALQTSAKDFLTGLALPFYVAFAINVVALFAAAPGGDA
jgi:hypothetical protein